MCAHRAAQGGGGRYEPCMFIYFYISLKTNAVMLMRSVSVKHSDGAGGKKKKEATDGGGKKGRNNI